MRISFVATICLACWVISMGFPVAGYNSLNESAESALPLNIPALDSLQANLSQGGGLNYSDYIDEMTHYLTNNETSMSSSVNHSCTNCKNNLRIVDYWGNYYSCNAKCVFLHDVARMIVVPRTNGCLKLYEKNPDGYVVGSRNIPVSAHERYNWWFIGDIEGLHTLWFTLVDRYGQVSRSNDVTFQVILENCCPNISNCSPTS